jgi:hypothetical protein
MTRQPQPVLTIPQLHDFLERDFPQVAKDFIVTEVGPMRLCLRLVPGEPFDGAILDKMI